MPIEFQSSAQLLSVHLGGADVLVTGGTLTMTQVTGVGDITITNGDVNLNDVICGQLTLSGGTGDSVIASKLTCNGMSLTGGSIFQDVIINGLRMPTGQLLVTGDFYEFSILNGVIGQRNTSPAAALPAVVFDGVTGFQFGAEVYRSARQGMIFDDCVAGDIYANIIDPGSQTDNTYDGIQLLGVCDRLALHGSVRGAVRQANNPRYGLDVANTCLAIDSWLTLSGYQTGAINDPGGVVVVH